jgi:fatty-acid desaturase
MRRETSATREGTAGSAARLQLPAGVLPAHVFWTNAIVIFGYHLVALLAFMPRFFSWTGVILFILGDYVFGVLGINLCYHRLLTHRGFKTPKWFEYVLATLAICSVQDTPARWVAVHRRHHQHADEQPDPHSPLVNFLWGHLGWVLIDNRELTRLGIYDRYAKDILRDPFYRWIERYYVQGWFILASWFLFYGGGFLAVWATGGTLRESVQFGASLLVWGIFVRTVVVWHQTWAVNSITHLWGYRNYETDEESRNNIFVGILSNGEGWHNNHHADPRAAKHGHLWWEFDSTYLTIRLLAALGLASNIIMPRERALTPRGLVTRHGGDIPDA